MTRYVAKDTTIDAWKVRLVVHDFMDATPETCHVEGKSEG